MTTPDRAALTAETNHNRDGYIPMTRHQVPAAVLLSLAMLFPARAFASGVIGPFPIQPQKFQDFAACKAYLEEQHASDLTVVGGTTSTGGHEMPKRSLETRGIVQTGDREAHYDSVIGYLSRMVDGERKAIRSQYSYEKKWYVCNDGMLTGTEQRGYHIETYEPLE